MVANLLRQARQQTDAGGAPKGGPSSEPVIAQRPHGRAQMAEPIANEILLMAAGAARCYMRPHGNFPVPLPGLRRCRRR
jgi:hypothetical protein